MPTRVVVVCPVETGKHNVAQAIHSAWPGSGFTGLISIDVVGLGM